MTAGAHKQISSGKPELKSISRSMFNKKVHALIITAKYDKNRDYL
jgi:hypothetical protein